MNQKKDLLKYALLCLVSWALWGCTPSKEKTNKENVELGRYVVVLSFDGFRADYQALVPTPALDQMDQDGLSGRFMPCYPSLTFPNHYSMATGLYPDHHGLVGNEFWTTQDEHYKLNLREAVSNPKFYGGEPIWNTAGRQGLKTACYFWVGSEAKIGGRYPDIWKKYDGNTSFSARTDSIVKWLELPEAKRPRLIMCYFDEPDHAGHIHGTKSQEVLEAIKLVDQQVGNLRAKLSRLDIAPQIDLIIVSDHGMQDLDRRKAVKLSDYLELDKVKHYTTGACSMLYLEPDYVDKAYKQLQGVAGIQVFPKEKLPKDLHFGTNERVGDLVLLADLGVEIYMDRPKRLKATHGFDNHAKEMLALFKAVGPDFQAGRVIQEPIPNITLYPLLCKLLWIKSAKHDADPRLATVLLEKTP